MRLILAAGARRSQAEGTRRSQAGARKRSQEEEPGGARRRSQEEEPGRGARRSCYAEICTALRREQDFCRQPRPKSTLTQT